jgi:dihydrofolate reductase
VTDATGPLTQRTVTRPTPDSTPLDKEAAVSEVHVIEYMTLDGVIQAPGHAQEDTDGGFVHGGWTGPFMREHRRHVSAAFQNAGAFLFGRRTYDIFAGYWPTVTDDGDHIAHALNTLPKFVVTTTPLTTPTWSNTTAVTGDLDAEISILKARPGKPIVVVGSSQLVHYLTGHELVDQYQLWLHPRLLGRGKRLFDHNTPATALQLTDSLTTPTGLVILTYSVTPGGVDHPLP